MQAREDVLVVNGYLGHEEMGPVFKEVEKIKETVGGKVIVQLSSSSGDFQEVFSFAQNLFELRNNNDKLIVVYIQGRAVGPAAIIPFVADELLVTPYVAWGDIPYGVHYEMNWERARSMVKGLINQSLERAPVLVQLADAMIDPHHQLIYERGKPIIEREGSKNFEPLILNLKGMQSLGLVSLVITDKEFEANYFPDKSAKDIAHLYKGIVTDYVTPAELQTKMKKHIHYSETEENLIGYLQLSTDHPIRQSTYLYFKFALEEFKKRKVRFVVINVDTPGGEVLSSLKIVDLLQKMDLEYGIPIIAYIDDWAVSAGAMIAYACRFIFVNPSSLMGAAEPVLAKEGAMETAPEKVNSALRAEFSNLANFYGRNELLAQGMVDKDMILVIRNHQIVKLDSETQIRSGGSNPDILISGRGKLLTLNAKQLIDLGVADYKVDHSVTYLEKLEDNALSWPAKKSPVFEQPYLKNIPHAVMISFEDWRITFFTVLSNPIIMSLLFIGLVIGFYIEINTPGFGIPGSIGLACLALILLASFSVEAIHWIELIILGAGLILLMIELFVIPGFGVVGILGIILTIIGLFALMLPGIDKLNFFHWDSFQLIGAVFLERLAWLSAALILSIVLIILLARFYSHRFFRFSKFVLHGEQEGFVAGIPRELMPEEGELGETVTPLRPSGKVHIGEHLYDAMAQTGYLEKNMAIEVVRVEGSRLIVRPVELKGKK
ncbi:NfeD family protein [Simkania sp.]|uniref:NfeD family protein n=1 Tax=Simkania sp. TaxID=34094 RepID=UPI003B52A69B